jgi:adenylylsulfate kinase
MTQDKATNITWHDAVIKADDRKHLNGHGGVVLWLTGLPSSGKSTLACAVESLLFKRGCHTYILDGDNIRHGLNKNLGFSPEDRKENIRRIGEVAKLFADAGTIVMTAFISPYREDRDSSRKLLPPGGFMEIYCKCPVEVCEKRDPKGLYKKARAGQIKDFTGVDAPYEAPLNAEIVVNTDKDGIEKSAEQVLACLEEKGIIPGPARTRETP